MADLVNKRFLIFDNVVEIIGVEGERVTFLTYKKGEDRKTRGECNILLFNIDDLEKYELKD